MDGVEVVGWDGDIFHDSGVLGYLEAERRGPRGGVVAEHELGAEHVGQCWGDWESEAVLGSGVGEVAVAHELQPSRPD